MHKDRKSRRFSPIVAILLSLGLSLALSGDLYAFDFTMAFRAPGYASNCTGLSGGTWVDVPGNSIYGTTPFCVQKYIPSGTNTSQAGVVPRVNIDQPTARTACSSLGSGYHLITNPEWMTVAANIANINNNWSNYVIGSGTMSRGHSDNSPASACAADASDANAWVETTCTGQTQGSLLFNQRRTQNLSNGSVIWDFGGNVWQWVDAYDPNGKPGTASNAWNEYSSMGSGTANWPRSAFVPLNSVQSWWTDSWNSSQSIGQIYPSTNGAGGALRRGAYWNDGTSAGPFAAYLVSGPSHAGTGLGVRCAYTPTTTPTYYTVTYNGNSNTSGSVPTDPLRYVAGDTVIVSRNISSLARTNYIFGGWNTAADGSGTTYMPWQTFAITDNTTLYAKWDAPLACNGLAGGTWVSVPGDSLYGTSNFCVQKYMASNNGSNVPTSQTGVAAWGVSSQTDSKTNCQNLGSGYHLLTNPEWMSIAANLANVSSNWSGGSVGSGKIPAGLATPSGCAAGASDANGWGCPAQSQGAFAFDVRRTHTLSNGSVIWDFSGSLWKILDYNNANDKPLTQNAWVEYSSNTIGSPTTPRSHLVPINSVQNWWNDSWNSTQGLGTIYTGGNGYGGALIRGSHGVFSSYWEWGPETLNSGYTGFRCAYTPTTPTYNVIYATNNATGGSAPAPTAYTNGQTVTVASNSGTLYRNGYTFGGWNTAANGSGTTYAAGSGTFTMGSANVTLYAKWNAITPNYSIVLTTGSSYTIPEGYTSVKAWAIGGGGGGAGATTANATAGGGGGAGGVAYKTYTVIATGGTTVSFSLGAAGIGYAGASNGGAGGTTTVTINSVTISGNGGGGGIYNSPTVGSGGTFTGGDGGANGGNGSGVNTNANRGGGSGGGIGGASGTWSSGVFTGFAGAQSVDVSSLFSTISSAGYPTSSGGSAGSGAAVAYGGSAGSATGFGCGGGSAGTYGGNGGSGLYGGGGGGAAGYATYNYTGGNGGGGAVVLQLDFTYSYNVSYDSNGATGGTVPTDTTAYNSGATVTVASNSGSLTRSGYVFAGWNTAADGSGTNYTAGSGTFTITGAVTLYAKWNRPPSCFAWYQQGNITNGIYQIDPGGTGSNINVYCDMTTSGGGWTLVAAQFESDQMTNWNEGIQADYDPSLATSKSFALNTAQIPAHTQMGVGKQLDPTFLTSFNYTYTTGNIATTSITGADGNSYWIHRNTANLYPSHNPNRGLVSDPNWNNTLTVEGYTGAYSTGDDFTWAYSPQHTSAVSRSYAMKASLWNTSETYAWTIWVRSITYSVTYSANSATGGTAPASTTHAPNTTVTVASNSGSLTRTGYSFAGWNTAANGSGTTYAAASGTFTITGNVTLYAKWNRASCSAWYQEGSTTNGIYQIDPGGTGSNINVYCDMTTSGGGWTLVAAQFESDQMTNWNEGIQADYDPSLATSKSFALNTAQIPAHTQMGVGKQLDPTFLTSFNYTYTTGNIARTIITGADGNGYLIHRNTSNYYDYHNPDATGGYNNSEWNNTLTIEGSTGAYSTAHDMTWAFSPQASNAGYRGFGLRGQLIFSSETYAWTIWVR